LLALWKGKEGVQCSAVVVLREVEYCFQAILKGIVFPVFLPEEVSRTNQRKPDDKYSCVFSLRLDFIIFLIHLFFIRIINLSLSVVVGLQSSASEGVCLVCPCGAVLAVK
jgi:hypothetical protein